MQNSKRNSTDMNANQHMLIYYVACGFLLSHCEFLVVSLTGMHIFYCPLNEPWLKLCYTGYVTLMQAIHMVETLCFTP
jgi:hypothetical protein